MNLLKEFTMKKSTKTNNNQQILRIFQIIQIFQQDSVNVNREKKKLEMRAFYQAVRLADLSYWESRLKNDQISNGVSHCTTLLRWLVDLRAVPVFN